MFKYRVHTFYSTALASLSWFYDLSGRLNISSHDVPIVPKMIDESIIQLRWKDYLLDLDKVTLFV